MRILVQGFHDPKVGGICGHADVLNVRENWITKMQAVRYFVAFSVNKAAESVFSAVTCCSRVLLGLPARGDHAPPRLVGEPEVPRP